MTSEPAPLPPPPLARDELPKGALPGDEHTHEPRTDQEAEPLPHLGRFYGKLRSLTLRERESFGPPKDLASPPESLRIAWFGDSHVAADFLTDAVRRHLYSRATAGGPGYLRVGLKDSRHGQAKFSLSGRFRHEPYLPAQRERFGDGIFGLGGVRTIPTSGALFSLRSKSNSDQAAVYRVQVRLNKGDALRLRLGDDRKDLRGPLPATAEEATAEILLEGVLGAQLLVEHLAGQPEVFGAIVETREPGVVLDTIGINGARAATMLAWDEGSFVESLRRRGTDLVVLAFGTNEAFDSTPVSRFPAHYASVLGRARAALPQVECLIVGPPDAQSKAGPSLVRVREIAEELERVARSEKCGFIDARGLMGGEGSFGDWRNRAPALARNDRVHLTIAGYEELGNRIARVLLPEDFEL